MDLRMPRAWIVVSFVVVWIALTILALTWGVMFDWPDYVHVNYGVPLVWVTHVLNTIIGPVDIWRVDLFVLPIDLLFWMELMVIALAIMLHILYR